VSDSKNLPPQTQVVSMHSELSWRWYRIGKWKW